MARRRSKIVDIDKGWDRIKREIEKSNVPHTVVGVFGTEAAKDHGGQPNVQIAAQHEFGKTFMHPGGTAFLVTENGATFVSNAAAEGQDLPRTKPHQITIPERSFIRATVDAKKRAIVKASKEWADKVLTGELERKKALEMIGVLVQGFIRGRISKGIPPPLKPATIRRKGSSKPLIDTGQLRASIDYEVRNTK